MVYLEVRFEDGSVTRMSRPLPLYIGRSRECGVCLDSWRVARRHAYMTRRDAGVYLQDLGSLGGTRVNGLRITDYGPLMERDDIGIGPCTIRVVGDHDDEPAPAAARASMLAPATDENSAPCIPDQIIDRSIHRGTRFASGAEAVPDGVPATSLPYEAFEMPPEDLHNHRQRLHQALLESLDLRRRDIAGLSDAALRQEAARVLAELIRTDPQLPDTLDRTLLLQDVLNEALGLGVLEPLLADPDITEIMVNRHDQIFVEKRGSLRRYSGGFSSEQAVRGVIERIVSPLGRRIDESSPMVDARLGDGSRINAVIPPIALRGASLTIRKFPQSRPGMDDLLRCAALDASMSEFLAACIQARKNIVVSGGTGTGKTTLLNILSNCIGENERVITIEDAAELRLDHEHLVSLESRPPNAEGQGRIEIRDLVRNALRMRPDRIVIGECRGGEAFDMLAAMNTGHEGSLTTLHANSPRDALTRLETMILMAGMDLPLVAVREHIAASIDFIVQKKRLRDGHRLVASIVEVTGLESGRIQTQEIFRYQARPSPAFVGCGIVPECFVDETGQAALPMEMFSQHTELNARGELPVWMSRSRRIGAVAAGGRSGVAMEGGMA